MNLKNILKTFKLNESTISMVLGAVVIVIVGVLVVNYFKKTSPKTNLPGVTATEETIAPKVGEKYIVQEGDNLWKIAEKAYGSGYNWVDIAKENGLANAGLIEKGQELIIPNVESRLATIVKSEETITGNTYTVVKGDSLWKIAVRAYGDGYKWVEIAKVNNLENPDIIHSGNVLTLPR